MVQEVLYFQLSVFLICSGRGRVCWKLSVSEMWMIFARLKGSSKYFVIECVNVLKFPAGIQSGKFAKR